MTVSQYSPTVGIERPTRRVVLSVQDRIAARCEKLQYPLVALELGKDKFDTMLIKQLLGAVQYAELATLNIDLQEADLFCNLIIETAGRNRYRLLGAGI